MGAAMRLRRVMETLGEEARTRICDTSSSGSEHSPDDADDLWDLVNSFIETDNGVQREPTTVTTTTDERDTRSRRRRDPVSDPDNLRRILLRESDDVNPKIRAEAEIARRQIGGTWSAPEFKRLLTSRLRDAGFDAGLCKSRWEKNSGVPSGTHEYIDINIAGIRYVVEVNLAGGFDIARPTNRYASLLENFPTIFLGKAEELEQVVKIMCKETLESMKSMEMPVPPWRRYEYMQAKWFSPYKRTINMNSTEFDEGLGMKRSIGIEGSQGISYYCRARRGGSVRHLEAALNGHGLPL